MSKTAIPQTRPVAPYLGGKRNLAKRICAIIDADQHSTYAEPFVGMGGIFLRRAARPKAEFINDAGRDVYNLFRILEIRLLGKPPVHGLSDSTSDFRAVGRVPNLPS